jgi:NADH-quinone oxidoreductase subunit A
VSFCIIAIVFLLFDIEVLFLLPWASTFSLTTKWGFFTMYMFFCLVSLGLYVEWYKGVLINVGG